MEKFTAIYSDFKLVQIYTLLRLNYFLLNSGLYKNVIFKMSAPDLKPLDGRQVILGLSLEMFLHLVT